MIKTFYLFSLRKHRTPCTRVSWQSKFYFVFQLNLSFIIITIGIKYTLCNKCSCSRSSLRWVFPFPPMMINIFKLKLMASIWTNEYTLCVHLTAHMLPPTLSLSLEKNPLSTPISVCLLFCLSRYRWKQYSETCWRTTWSDPTTRCTRTSAHFVSKHSARWARCANTPSCTPKRYDRSSARCAPNHLRRITFCGSTRNSCTATASHINANTVRPPFPGNETMSATW